MSIKMFQFQYVDVNDAHGTLVEASTMTSKDWV